MSGNGVKNEPNHSKRRWIVAGAAAVVLALAACWLLDAPGDVELTRTAGILATAPPADNQGILQSDSNPKTN